jgi:hypothetical protein
MKIFKMMMVFMCSVFIANIANAFNKYSDNTLELKIKNDSTEILHYTGVTNTNPGSIFTINTTDLFPGGEAVVTCTNSPYYDLSGQLHFNDQAGNGNLLTVIVRRMFHYGQPIFSMRNNQFISFLKSKEFNTDGGNNPQALSYIAANVVIEKNPVPQDSE